MPFYTYLIYQAMKQSKLAALDNLKGPFKYVKTIYIDQKAFL